MARSNSASHVLLSEVDAGMSDNGLVVATCTWLAGDSALAETHLRRRLAEMVSLNPWLQGRLTRKVTPRRLPSGRRQLHLVYERTATGLTDSLFTTHDDSSLSESSPYAESCQRFEPYLAPGGEDAVDASGEAPLFRVALVRISQCSYAIVESLNHAVGDGSTFYELHKMLSVGSRPRALIVERHTSFLKEQVTGHLVGDLAVLCESYYPTMVRNVLKGSVCTATVQPISAAWIEAQKNSAELPADVKFLSSNDIIMSFLGRHADVTFMLKNMRGCAAGVTAAHAGNYSALLLLLAEDCASPSMVRRSLSSVRRVSHKRPLPGVFSLGQFALPRFTQKLTVTNWASLYGEADAVMPAAEMVRHQPIMLNRLAKPSCGQLALPFDAVTIFRPRRGELAMLYLGSHLGMTPCKLAALGGPG